MTLRRRASLLHLFLLLVNSSPVLAAESDVFDPYAFVTNPRQLATARMLVEFFEAETRPPPFEIRTGKAFEHHKQLVRHKLLKAMGLDPLPQRLDLDLHVSEPLAHPWCLVRKAHYQIWPGVYSEAFLYVPEDARNKRRPAILSLTGHWTNTKANAEEQKRCLNFARLGYVVLATEHEHYEDLALGISHQTHNVWSNLRALDVLESLPYVDKDRIGACGGSGGGLQTQMLLALDARVKAATIVGMICDYREFLFPHVASAVCVHFPGALRIADQPEISALGMPTPVLYIIMDDFTKNFARNSFPAIQQLYRSNGYPDHVDCRYWPTEHNYDRPKREATYNWMQKWLRNDPNPVAEPKTVTFPIPRLLALDTGLPASSRDLERLPKICASERKYDPPDIQKRNDSVQYRECRIEALRELLGMEEALPLASSEVLLSEPEERSGVTLRSVSIPVEGTFRIPVTMVEPPAKRACPQ